MCLFNYLGLIFGVQTLFFCCFFLNRSVFTEIFITEALQYTYVFLNCLETAQTNSCLHGSTMQN